ncbi:hypothetical protein LJB99_04340 [Deltaproteobacteria bacterium OttesenSCG-928-K17]|nr:hypothetical protein [Deltaproteobacteria bacterium OttesenSCG-928-K17]
MTEDQMELIDQLMGKQLSKEEFAELFFKAEDNRSSFILKLLENAFVRKNSDDVECCMYVAFVFDLFSLEYIPILSKLLAEDWHIDHEDIATLFQKFRRPETIDVLYKTALRKFKYLDYNDSSALAVKCIWALGDIGTKAAKTKLELLAKSDNEIIRDNAVYQLTGLGRTWKDE